MNPGLEAIVLKETNKLPVITSLHSFLKAFNCYQAFPKSFQAFDMTPVDKRFH